MGMGYQQPIMGLQGGYGDDPSKVQAIFDKWKQFPGRAPNGTGETGLASNDMQGYSDMLNERMVGLRHKAAMQGLQSQAPLYSGQ